MPNLLPMNGIDLTRLERTAEPLGIAFYVLVAMALILALAGFPGHAFLLLVFGSLAHAARAGIEEFVAARRNAEACPKSMRTAPRQRVARTRSVPAAERRRVAAGR